MTIALVVGEVLSHPARHPVGTAPTELSAQAVTLPTLGNDSVSGWFIKGKPGYGAVLLLHGIRADRWQMLPRAKFLNKIGYAVLLVDLPAHGESTGQRISFGFYESVGVNTALAYLAQQLPHEKVAVIGVSLGAASLVLSEKHPRLHAVVLESMFPTITEAVDDRLTHYLGPVGHYFAPLLLWQLPYKVNATAEQLRPIAALPFLHVPVFIVSGTKDWHTTPAETQQIFQAANTPKQLWLVDGAAHEDLHSFDTHAYEAKISAFLANYLNHEPPLPNQH